MRNSLKLPVIINFSNSLLFSLFFSLNIEFINPFFEALGWDVSNKQGFAEQYKEVIYEDVIKVGRSTRAPDYMSGFLSAMFFASSSRQLSISFKNSLSTSAVPFLPFVDSAYLSKPPLSTASFENTSYIASNVSLSRYSSNV